MEKQLILSSSSQIGGNTPEVTIKTMKTNINQYLTFADKTMEFMFDNNNTNTLGASSFIAHGSYTAVFSIELTKNKTNVVFDPKIRFILRVTNEPDNEFKEYIEKWKIDKQAFPKNIIDIFFYGNLVLNNTVIGKYTITKFYYDHEYFLPLNLYQKQKFMCNILRFLLLMQQNNIFYRDLKWNNIGYDNEDDLNLIVIDYDNITLLRPNDKFLLDCVNLSKNKNVQNYNNDIHMCSGTHIPYYMTFDSPDTNKNFDKNYCVALALILLDLYFNNDDMSDIFYKKSIDQKTAVRTLLQSHRKTLDNPTDIEYINSIFKNGMHHYILNAEPNFTQKDCTVTYPYYTVNTYVDFVNYLRCNILHLVVLNYDEIVPIGTMLNQFYRLQTKILPDFITEDDLKVAYCPK